MNTQERKGKKNANMADNQVAFRKLNSNLKILIDELEGIALQRGEQELILKKNEVYHFYCECSDEDCKARIPIRFNAYEKAHDRDDTFIILQGHEVFDIEEVISKTSNYCVVQKFETPKQSNEQFHETTLNNTD